MTESLAALQSEGLVPAEPSFVGGTATFFRVHLTGPGHKVHFSDVALFTDTGRWNIGRPHCGSDRWGTYRNSSLTKAPVTCGRCLRHPRPEGN